MEKYATFSRCFAQNHLLSFETAKNSSNQFTALKEKINRLAQHNSTRTTSPSKKFVNNVVIFCYAHQIHI